MDTNSKVFGSLKTALRVMLSEIGPTAAFAAGRQTFPFQDDVVHTDFYFVGGVLLRKLPLAHIARPRGPINFWLALALFKDMAAQVYERIKAREGTVQATLDTYLRDDDVLILGNWLEELLKAIHDRYKLTLVTTLIILKDVDSLTIGNVQVRQINADFIADWPERYVTAVERPYALLVQKPAKYESKDQFLTTHADSTALEIEVEAFHFNEEKSPAFDAAVNGIRKVFGYLAVCEFFLSRVKGAKFTIEKQELPPRRSGLLVVLQPRAEQFYYVRKTREPNFIRLVDPVFPEILYSRDVFVISPQVMTQLKERCYLDNFNKSFSAAGYGVIGNKIATSLDWFLKANLEDDPTDIILSLFISLEALLSVGTDPLMSLIDEMAENVAIMIASTVEERYRWKSRLKKWYRTRSKIVHGGEVVDYDEYEQIVGDLKACVAWSVIGILARIDDIVKYGTKAEAIKQYFDREKLK